MQTFLPYEDFIMSAMCLDNKRLGNQRKEVLQIIQTLKSGPYQVLVDGSWVNCSPK